MNVEEAYTEVKRLVIGLPFLFRDAHVDLAFGLERPCIGDWSDPENRGFLINGDGIGESSGIYFFTAPSGEILHIGKASKNNLHDRVWHHVKTPISASEGQMTFPNHSFRPRIDTPEHTAFVASGRVRLSIVTVSPRTSPRSLKCICRQCISKNFIVCHRLTNRLASAGFCLRPRAKTGEAGLPCG